MSIVVAIQTPIGGTPQMYLMRPDGHHDAGRPLSINPGDFQSLQRLIGQCNGSKCPIGVKKIGRKFMHVLSRHPAIRDDVLPRLDLLRQDTQPFYLYFVHPDEALESMPWESMFAPNVGFLAKDRRFSVARARRVGGRTEWEFQAPLRIQAVLGASGTEEKTRFSGRQQWEGIRDAVLAQQAHVPVAMSVLTCEETLLNQINAEGLPWVKTELIHDRAGLFASIQNFRPNFLHFFCHGVSKPTPHLQVASFKDWGAWKDGGVIVEAAQFAQQANRYADIWLVTLNCCESAEAGVGKTSRSLPMISAMVEAGIPTAVGMREIIGIGFADLFCKLFYNELLSDFRDWLTSARPGDGAELHWAHSLSGFRLCNTGGCFGWTVPIMQTRLDPFRLRLTPKAPALRELVAELLQLQDDRKLYEHHGAGSPILNRIDQRIEQIKQILTG